MKSHQALSRLPRESPAVTLGVAIASKLAVFAVFEFWVEFHKNVQALLPKREK